jgi:CDGSH iron-sulfur domain-containing protein 3
MAEPIVIKIRENGPILIPAPIKLVDHLGNEYPLNVGKEFYALCRCGHSKNKPLCDGAHKECGFMGGPLAPAAPAAPPQPPAQ